HLNAYAAYCGDMDKKAARRGDVVPPVDQRFLKKGIPAAQSRDSDTSRARIISFLRQLYESVAETLPDVRDDSYEFDNASVVLDIPELSDPYAEAMSQKSQDIKPMADSSVRGGKRKIRKKKRSVVISSERKAEEDRYLPPGQMRDYWEQFKAAEGSDSGKVPVFSTFWRVWLQEFSFPKFRAQSSHSMCSTCVRHRFLIREMSGHLRAREEQQSLYTLHLRKQYFDRVCYWELRGLSRLRSFDAVLILDGMDQAKFAYPRSDFFRTKELAGVQRPRAHISACILHGRSVIFTEIPEDFKQQLLKAMPGMRKYGLESAAIYLEQWLQDSLPLEPLLDISACAAYPEQPSTGDLAPSVQDLEPEPGLLQLRGCKLKVV
ncbi:FO synthase subunit 1, partial [Durusdinium trenchii]